MTNLVLDTSAALAAFLREPGADVVRERGAGGMVSSVNLSETLTKLSDRNAPIEEAAH